MSNYCYNLLTCTSAKPLGDVINPYLTNDRTNIDFNKIAPMPEGILKSYRFKSLGKPLKTEERELEGMESVRLEENNLLLYGYKNWYDWRLGNWGTTSEPCDCRTLEECSGLTIDKISCLGFDTLWGPPINVIRQLTNLTGESFRIYFFGEGWDYGGVYSVSPDGESEEYYNHPAECPEIHRKELNVEYYLKIRMRCA